MAVKPVVEDIAGRMSDRVSFQILDASQGKGLEVYNALSRPGHPSYVMLTPDGKELYRSFGFKTERAIESAIEGGLNKSSGRAGD
jgi:hypothetical protein